MLSPLWAGEVGRATSEYLAPFILPTAKPGNPQVERGRYLVTLGQCHDCHTPKGAGGRPQLDRLLSGHPEGLAPAPAVQDAISITPTLTSFTGPWGTSFTRNLTPDEETGIGKWTEQDFLKVLRTGIRKNGAAVLPPMPWEYLTQLTDEDLKAMFAYLRSIPPLKNRVPENLPPQRR
ncbi:MAG: cytochrome c [Nitrospinae bacterium]|nr:cytochrome c [Nitrospinota bacterium]